MYRGLSKEKSRKFPKAALVEHQTYAPKMNAPNSKQYLQRRKKEIIIVLFRGKTRGGHINTNRVQLIGEKGVRNLTALLCPLLTKQIFIEVLYYGMKACMAFISYYKSKDI